MQGADLKRLNPDYTATTVISGVGSARMVYMDVAGSVFLTNGTIIGNLRDYTFQFFPEPQQPYKTPMVSGHMMEYLKSSIPPPLLRRGIPHFSQGGTLFIPIFGTLLHSR